MSKNQPVNYFNNCWQGSKDFHDPYWNNLQGSAL